MKQTVNHGKDGGSWTFTPPDQTFTVGAPRFSLTAGDVLACFPAPGSTTPSGRLLPYVSLRNPYLPWERSKTPPTGWEKAPGMALLVLADGESTQDVMTGPASTLLTPGGTRLLPDHGTTPLPQDPCTTIDLSPANLLRLLPDPTHELALLAHVRREVRPGTDGSSTPVPTPAHSAIIANRFPRTVTDPQSGNDRPCHYTAHLVSLLGHEQNLDPANLRKLAPSATMIRLISLWSWSFTTSVSAQETYAEAFANLTAHCTGPGKTSLRFAPPPASTVSTAVSQRLQAGYIPMPYRSAAGENTAAWYRGPLTPWPPTKTPLPEQHQPFSCADEALIYSSADGMLDISLAAAWTIGYQLVLSRRDLFGQLLTLRPEAARSAMRLAMATRFLAAENHYAAETATPLDLDDILDPMPMRQGFDAMMTGTRKNAQGNTRADRRPLGEDITTALSDSHSFALPPAAAIATAVGPDHGEPLAHHAARLLERPDAALALKKSLRRRHSPAHNRKATGADAENLAYAYDATGTDPAETWFWDPLDLLALLPPCYLLPMADATLPPDSVRFFSVDQRWLSALADGMLAMGAHTTLDLALTPHLADIAFKPRTTGGKPPFGMLMRSEIIRAWPDHPPRGSSTEQSTVPWPAEADEDPGCFTFQDAELISRTRIGPDTVLLLLTQRPAKITLQEPGHVLQFGLDNEDSKTIRSVDGKTQGEGVKVFDDFLYGEIWPGHRRETLNVTQLANRLCGNNPDSASFAFHMLNPPARLVIDLTQLPITA
ncbi:hypothetical protein [Streptomyces formicae]|uniref:Uncharacterized protein n=1 Tax=Streptomyces formicae TaxID=1616117 RepID=A0ABY3WTS5_9ACTN|nr:hypothetical protein [Streptomyces formicae]UNM14966.1 hypothetical protein J4032_28995 [Streptomyces formicae]